ncbi:LytTR family DNA-binding domain-containing protein [Pedobacter sp. KR3-3]|uniref:LytTR family DNA-binding domain-containing protein n=1 Tax=Pedobacter albus TaxID=3113905 RepID=A0ABU7I8Y9_9SPHI|nr:LytTR family DNA-binding domain-containing protein [Pedobacter sp. KR3-3]MEE1945925.1 LytTR family DNA-binding domain-containing protein [Pedobacter sp. KR3-3]
MNCLIIDDNEIARLTLRQLTMLDPSLNVVGECSDAAIAYAAILANQIDLLLLDIEMPGMSGIDLAKSFVQRQPLIIFTTSKKDYAVEAFELNVVDFITKPIAPARFLQAIEKAKETLKNKNGKSFEPADEFMFIRDSNVVRRLKINDILYLEAKGDYVRIATKDNLYTIHSSLKAMQDKLPAHIFLKVHRSYIINVGKIDTLEGGTLVIGQNLVPVSDAYKNLLNKRMQII